MLSVNHDHEIQFNATIESVLFERFEENDVLYMLTYYLWRYFLLIQLVHRLKFTFDSSTDALL